jgi:carbohydrate-selective porin OprB
VWCLVVRETGLAVDYRFGVTPCLHVTPDLQVIKPATGKDNKRAAVFALRAKLTL